MPRLLVLSVLLAAASAVDLVRFDANEIIDEATFSEPHTYPTGIEAVIVNGVQVIDGERHTDALPGQLLRRRGSELR